MFRGLTGVQGPSVSLAPRGRQGRPETAVHREVPVSQGFPVVRGSKGLKDHWGHWVLQDQRDKAARQEYQEVRVYQVRRVLKDNQDKAA